MQTPPVNLILEKKAVIVNGQQVWYREIGSGIPVLILAGWGGPTDKYVPFQSKLAAKDYKVILPDLPGLPGKTSSVFMDVSAWSQWILDFSRTVNLGSFFMLSHSLSTRIALEYLSGENISCRSAILLGPWIISSSTQGVLWRSFARVLRFLSPLIFPDMKWVKDANAWKTALALLSAVRIQPTITCLILWGKRDPARILLSGWRKIRCQARQYDWDHSPQIRDTDQLVVVVDEFFRQTDVSP
jgi:pimeloyl-ACP methyl ester carboxylesterase